VIHRSLRRFAALGLAAVALAGGCSGAGGSLNDAATIRYEDDDGTEHVIHLTREEFEDELDLLAQREGVEPGPDGTIPTADSAGWLTQNIYLTAVALEVEALEIEVTDEQRDRARTNVAEFGFGEELSEISIEGQAQVEALTDAVREDSEVEEPTEADAREVYETNLESFTACPSGRNVEQVAFQLEVDAQAAFDRIAEGETFAEAQEVAEFYESTCLENSQFGQDAAFAEAVGAAELGEVTGPVASEQGFHVLVATEFAPTFEQFRDQILEQLTQEAQQAAEADFNQRISEAIGKWIDRFDVTIDPRYGTWEETEEAGWQVVAPVVPDPSEGRGDDETVVTVPPIELGG